MEIPLPQSNTDIYAFGFDKSLNKETDPLITSNIVYDSVDNTISPSSLDTGNIFTINANALYLYDKSIGGITPMRGNAAEINFPRSDRPEEKATIRKRKGSRNGDNNSLEIFYSNPCQGTGANYIFIGRKGDSDSRTDNHTKNVVLATTDLFQLQNDVLGSAYITAQAANADSTLDAFVGSTLNQGSAGATRFYQGFVDNRTNITFTSSPNYSTLTVLTGATTSAFGYVSDVVASNQVNVAFINNGTFAVGESLSDGTTAATISAMSSTEFNATNGTGGGFAGLACIANMNNAGYMRMNFWIDPYNIVANKSILPWTNSYYNLGSPAKQFKNIYFSGDLYKGGSAFSPGGAIFGDGSDGDYTASGESITTDMYYDNLTIAAGQYLYTAGYRVFVKDTLTVETGAWIGRPGYSGSNGATGTSDGNESAGGAGGTALADGTLPGGLIGKVGGGGAGGGFSSGANAPASTAGTDLGYCVNGNARTGVSGGNGGSGDSGGNAGGSGTTGSSNNGTRTATTKFSRNISTCMLMCDLTSGTSINFFQTSPQPGAGSGGGAGGGCGAPVERGGGAGAGGGSGSHGGFSIICAKNIIINGLITVEGGVGGDGGDGVIGAGTSAGGGGGGAGGAGGNGGVLFLVYNSLTNNGEIRVTGGTGGSPGSGGPAGGGSSTAGGPGTVGNDGNTGTLVQIQN